MARRKGLAKILREAGIYNAKLEPQIRLTERLESLVDRLADELSTADLVEIEINASGTERKVVNPIVEKYMKLESQLQAAYTSLGLNYSVKPDNYKQAEKEDGGDLNLLERFGI